MTLDLNELSPELMVRGANLKFVPGYAIYFLGAATMVGSFVVAYRLAEQRSEAEFVAPALSEPFQVPHG